MAGVIVGVLVIAALLLFAGAVQAQIQVERKYKFEWHREAPIPERLLLMIRGAAAEAGFLPWEYLAAIVYIESRGNPRAINAGDPSYGIAQMMLPTASNLAGHPVTEGDLLNDPDFALTLAGRFLAILRRRYSARFAFAEWAQAYNVGEPRFDRGTRNPGYGAKVRRIADGQMEFLNPQQLAAEFLAYYGGLV